MGFAGAERVSWGAERVPWGAERVPWDAGVALDSRE